MKTFALQIATPEGTAYEGQAEMLALRGIEGELAIQAGHIPLITAAKAGSCRIYTENEEPRAAEIQDGLLAVSKDGVTLLTDQFVWAEAKAL